jgi:hypothetical protein
MRPVSRSLSPAIDTGFSHYAGEQSRHVASSSRATSATGSSLLTSAADDSVRGTGFPSARSRISRARWTAPESTKESLGKGDRTGLRGHSCRLARREFSRPWHRRWPNRQKEFLMNVPSARNSCRRTIIACSRDRRKPFRAGCWPNCQAGEHDRFAAHLYRQGQPPECVYV